MSSIKVSIILPVYQVEKYIEKCANSLFSQSLQDIEIIFVDDASPDNSIKIVKDTLNKYPDRKDQVKIISHKKNMGVSRSRQDGVDAAQGEYIIHCDPDDWVEKNTYEILYNNAKKGNYDMVTCDFIMEFKNSNKRIFHDFNISHSQLQYELLDINGKIRASLCNRLIKKDFIITSNVKFNEEISMMEDLLYLYPLHMNTKNTLHIPQPLYHYNQTNSNSLSHEFSFRQLNGRIKALQILYNQNQDIPTQKLIRKRIVNTALLPIISYHRFQPDLFRKHFSSFIVDYKNDITFFENLIINLVNKRKYNLAKSLLFSKKIFSFKTYLRLIK